MKVYSRGAEISACQGYRYDLSRRWGSKPGCVLWLMLNPSTADAERDDMTVKKCVEFSDRMGFHALHVVNLFALRATDPVELLKAADPVGPDNDFWIGHRSHSVVGPLKIVLAWGAPPLCFEEQVRRRINKSLSLISKPCFSLGLTLNGHPRHPSRLGYDAQLRPFTHDFLPAHVQGGAA